MHRTFYCVVTLFAFAVPFSAIASGQSVPLQGLPDAADKSWHAAQSPGSSAHRLFIVTLDQPNRRHTCRVKSFTPDRLICSRVIGGPRTYLRQQVAALLLPGDGRLKFWLVLGLNGEMGAAIWGTVVLAAACPACAVATGIAALYFFGGAGAVLLGDDRPDRLLYLAAGQQLSRKLGYVKS